MSWKPLRALPLIALCAASAEAALTPIGGSSADPGFVENHGQVQGPARYYVAGPGSVAYFEPTSVVLDRRPGAEGGPGVALRVDFPASRRPVTLVASEPLPVATHLYMGNEPDQWRSSVATYGEVRYRDVAPGADLVYKVVDGRLKYDVVIAPGADPAGVQIRYQGADRLEIAADGGLEIHTAAGVLREDRPYLYQERDGQRVEVRGGYRRVSRDVLGFWATGHDSRLPLVVDPGVTWSSFLGGSANDYPFRVAMATNGDIIIAGYTESDDYPVSSGAYQRTKNAGRDVMVTRMRGDGTGIVWSTFLGGAGVDHALAMAVDGSNNVFVAGNTHSTNFPVSTGAFRTTAGGGGDGFVARFNSSGGLVYSTYLGGVGSDIVNGIAVDASGVATVTGSTSSTNFPTTAGVVRRTLESEDGFVTRVNSTGTQLVYSTLVGCPGSDQLLAVALDGQGQATVVGRTNSAAFPTTPGVVEPSGDTFWDGIVVRLNSTATAYVYVTYLAGAGYDEPQAVAVDASGSAFVAGQTASPNFPISSGGYQRAKGGGTYDGFVVKLSPDARTLQYGTYLGGNGEEYLYGIALNTAGKAHIVGYGTSTNFPVTTGAHDSNPNGGYDAFVSRLSASGSALEYSSYLGGGGLDCARSIALRSNGDAVVVGYTASTGFPVTGGSFDQSLSGGGTYYDGFVSVLTTGSGSTAVEEAPPGAPGMTYAHPNPFLDRTTFGMVLAAPALVSVRVLDIRGRVVDDLGQKSLPAGEHRWTWDGRDSSGNDVGAGVFFLEVTSNEGRLTQRAVRLR